MSNETSARRIGNEVKYHFTHFKTHEFFLKLSLGSLLVFGFLAFLFAYVFPLNILFGIVAVCGFLLFGSLEVFGNIIGYVYQKGLFKGLAGIISVTLSTLLALIVFTLLFIYFILGGVIFFGTLMYSSMLFLPVVFKPLVIIGYTIGSIVWAANGISYWDGDTNNIPPLNLVNWIRN